MSSVIETRDHGCALRPYQEDAVRFLRSVPQGGAILGDSPGLGKTAVAATALKDCDRVLVVGPLIARGAWVGDDADPVRFAGRHVAALVGRRGIKGIPDHAEWAFLHYEIAHEWVGWAMAWAPQAIIADEAHLLRSRAANWTKAVLALAKFKSVERRIALTGTPHVNRPVDLWPLLEFARPGHYGSFHDFGVKYGAGEQTGYGWRYDGRSNEEELRTLLADVMIRRTREQVRTSLPPVSVQKVLVEIDAETPEVRTATAKAVRAILNTPQSLEHCVELLKISSQQKIAATTEQVAQLLGTGAKVVVFTWFREAVEKIASGFPWFREGVAKIASGLPVVFTATGDEDLAERQRRAHLFSQTPGAAAFVATMASAGTSINDLDCADIAIFHDLWWVPATIEQAMGRLDRGSKGAERPLHFYFMVGEGTIDEFIARRVLGKIESALALGIAGVDLDALGATEEDILAGLVADLRGAQ